MNIYGKTPEQLEAIIMLMQMTLNDYPYGSIRRGFERHIKESAVMPTPHDIINAIKKNDAEDNDKFYRPNILATEHDQLIHKLGLANFRRNLGVTRSQQYEIHELLDEWEKNNNQKVDWETIDEWREKHGAK